MLGFLFIAVTLYLPDGVVGLWRKLRARRAAALDNASAAPGTGRATLPAGPTAEESPGVRKTVLSPTETHAAKGANA